MGIVTSRKEIDRIDEELVHLLNRRAQIAAALGREKRDIGLSLCDPEREREIMERIRGLNPGPLDAGALEAIFQQVIRESKRLERRGTAETSASPPRDPAPPHIPGGFRVAFQGERGAFSEEAAVRLLGRNVECVPCPNFEALFAAVREGIADRILAPIENSLAGSVYRCYDLLLESELQIAGEVVLPISLCLVGPPGADFDQVRSVESHPVALAQCERFFQTHPHIKRRVAEDTAGSVRDAVCSGDSTRAAIGPRRAAEIYNGCILRERLEDHAENFTRFLLLSPSVSPATRANKLSLALQLPHRPGALFRALEPFAWREINLLKIESRPVKGHPWRYRFYLDLAAFPEQSEVKDALTELRNRADSVHILGWYAAAEEAYGD